jgi:hypothetical protein
MGMLLLQLERLWQRALPCSDRLLPQAINATWKRCINCCIHHSSLETLLLPLLPFDQLLLLLLHNIFRHNSQVQLAGVPDLMRWTAEGPTAKMGQQLENAATPEEAVALVAKFVLDNP